MACGLSKNPLTQNLFFFFQEQLLLLDYKFIKIRNHVSHLHFYPQGPASSWHPASPHIYLNE